MSYTIGIDIGGTKVLGGVVDVEGNLLKSARRDTPREGGTQLIATIAEVAKELLAEFKVESIGLSAAGFVSSDRKTMLATPNIAGWNGVDLDAQCNFLPSLSNRITKPNWERAGFAIISITGVSRSHRVHTARHSCVMMGLALQGCHPSHLFTKHHYDN
jgi:hypothetical protein